MLRAAAWGIALLSAMMLAGCERQAAHDGTVVDPRAHDAFYLWPGVHPDKGLRPKTVYLLDGEVRRGGAPRLERLRMGVPRLPGRTIWLVVRADRLDWDAGTYAAIVADIERWREAGNLVAGLQIDFDAATRGIEGYADFLRDLRQRLPRHWRLSITGLMDWSAHGDPKALAGLARIIDEVVIQTYQGRTTIPGYGAYFRGMAGFPIPFRVALVEGGHWRAPPVLSDNPHFRGYVIFLLSPAPSAGR